MANKISGGLLLLMAVSAGATVANNYYSQPILRVIADDLKIPLDSAGYIPLLSQLGYGLGLFLLVPLGDKVNYKRLILGLMLSLSTVLLLMFLSHTAMTIMICSFLIGCLSVSAQVIVPMASRIDPENRDKTLSALFLGMLVGILLSRILSGYMAQWLNWRYVYLFSSLVILASGLLLQWQLPPLKHEFGGNYTDLLRSTIFQFKEFPMLRRTALLGALSFGVFCSFWTTLTFHLSGAPFYYHSGTIGLLGLVSIIGGLLAGPFCRRIEKSAVKLMVLFWSLILLLITVVMIKWFSESFIVFILAAVFISLAIQSIHVTNIARIFSLSPQAVSRINTVYLVSYFLGGALGTFAGIQCWKYGGWPWVATQMIVFVLLTLLLVLGSEYRRKVVKLFIFGKRREHNYEL